VQGAEPPVLVVVGAGFFLAVVVVARVVGGAIGEVGVGIDTEVDAAVVLVSPLESEPQPVAAVSSAAAPKTNRRDRPTRIGPAM
jgi:hypothetical protein